MKDRVPTRPGRVLITPEDPNIQPYYATMQMADEPSEPGTPLNKGTLLSDVTAKALDLSINPTVDDALYRLYESLPTAPLSSDLIQFISGTHPILCAASLKNEKVAYVRWKFYTFDEITKTINKIVKDAIAALPVTVSLYDEPVIENNISEEKK